MSGTCSPCGRPANSVVAERMAQARKLRGLTQKQLGEQLEVVTGRPWSKATVSALERSAGGVRVRQFDADDLVAISCVLDVPLLFLFGKESATETPRCPDHAVVRCVLYAGHDGDHRWGNQT